MDVRVFGKYEFFTGVPDSLLKPFCDWLLDEYGTAPDKHIVAANEGNAAAIAAGYHLATGKIPVVYLQNSGIGNIINPAASLLSDKVYGIPVLFVVGWRGEPGVSDEPQHVFQGEITLKLLEDMDIAAFVIDSKTTEAEFLSKCEELEAVFAKGKSAAFVARKSALKYGGNSFNSGWGGKLIREDIIKRIAEAAWGDVIISTTGKTSRELFEIREQSGQGHESDFLTVGSMGHSSSIALGIAVQRPGKRVWVIDGDGAALMHMGAMAVIGAAAPENLIHTVINNAAHESVGCMPTAAASVDFKKLTESAGYRFSESVSCFQGLDWALEQIKTQKGPCFIEVKAASGSRENLGRPAETPAGNKEAFMGYLSQP